MNIQKKNRIKRKKRIRAKISGTTQRPRLSIYRSSKHMFAQVIDDTEGKVVAAAATTAKSFEGAGNKTEQSKKLGTLIAEKCKAKGLTSIVFDRNGFLYHGRIKALAEGAREAGLKF